MIRRTSNNPEIVRRNECMESKFDKALDYALDQICEWSHKDNVHAIYLFGSYARGDYKDTSDVDL